MEDGEEKRDGTGENPKTPDEKKKQEDGQRPGSNVKIGLSSPTFGLKNLPKTPTPFEFTGSHVSFSAPNFAGLSGGLFSGSATSPQPNNADQGALGGAAGAVPWAQQMQGSNSLAQPFGSPPFGSAPFGSVPFGSAPFGSASFGAAPFGSAPFGSAPFGSAPFGSAPFGSEPPSTADTAARFTWGAQRLANLHHAEKSKELAHPAGEPASEPANEPAAEPPKQQGVLAGVVPEVASNSAPVVVAKSSAEPAEQTKRGAAEDQRTLADAFTPEEMGELKEYQARARVMKKMPAGPENLGWGPLSIVVNGNDVNLVHHGDGGVQEISLGPKTSFSRLKEKSFLVGNSAGTFIIQHSNKDNGDEFYGKVVDILTKLKSGGAPPDAASRTRQEKGNLGTADNDDRKDTEKEQQVFSQPAAEKAKEDAAPIVQAQPLPAAKAAAAKKLEEKQMLLKKIQLLEAKKRLLAKKKSAVPTAQKPQQPNPGDTSKQPSPQVGQPSQKGAGSASTASGSLPSPAAASTTGDVKMSASDAMVSSEVAVGEAQQATEKKAPAIASLATAAPSKDAATEAEGLSNPNGAKGAAVAHAATQSSGSEIAFKTNMPEKMDVSSSPTAADSAVNQPNPTATGSISAFGAPAPATGFAGGAQQMSTAAASSNPFGALSFTGAVPQNSTASAPSFQFQASPPATSSFGFGFPSTAPTSLTGGAQHATTAAGFSSAFGASFTGGALFSSSEGLFSKGPNPSGAAFGSSPFSGGRASFGLNLQSTGSASFSPGFSGAQATGRATAASKAQPSKLDAAAQPHAAAADAKLGGTGSAPKFDASAAPFVPNALSSSSSSSSAAGLMSLAMATGTSTVPVGATSNAPKSAVVVPPGPLPSTTSAGGSSTQEPTKETPVTSKGAALAKPAAPSGTEIVGLIQTKPTTVPQAAKPPAPSTEPTVQLAAKPATDAAVAQTAPAEASVSISRGAEGGKAEVPAGSGQPASQGTAQVAISSAAPSGVLPASDSGRTVPSLLTAVQPTSRSGSAPTPTQPKPAEAGGGLTPVPIPAGQNQSQKAPAPTASAVVNLQKQLQGVVSSSEAPMQGSETVSGALAPSNIRGLNPAAAAVNPTPSSKPVMISTGKVASTAPSPPSGTAVPGQAKPVVQATPPKSTMISLKGSKPPAPTAAPPAGKEAEPEAAADGKQPTATKGSLKRKKSDARKKAAKQTKTPQSQPAEAATKPDTQAAQTAAPAGESNLIQLKGNKQTQARRKPVRTPEKGPEANAQGSAAASPEPGAPAPQIPSSTEVQPSTGQAAVDSGAAPEGATEVEETGTATSPAKNKPDMEKEKLRLKILALEQRQANVRKRRGTAAPPPPEPGEPAAKTTDQQAQMARPVASVADKTIALQGIKSTAAVQNRAEQASAVLAKAKTSIVDSIRVFVEKQQREFDKKLQNLRNSMTPNTKRKAEPNNEAEFYKRLRTFKASTWPCKWDGLNALECARNGWVNTGYNVLQCSETGNTIRYHDAAPDDMVERKRVRLLVRGSGHGMLSGWIGAASPEAFTSTPGSFVSVAAVQSRFSLLDKMSLNLQIKPTAFHQFRLEQVEKLKGAVPATSTLNAAVLAVFGWAPGDAEVLAARDRTVLACVLCGAEIPLEDNVEIDAFREHQWFCPLVRGLEMRTAFQALLQILNLVTSDSKGAGSGSLNLKRKRDETDENSGSVAAETKITAEEPSAPKPSDVAQSAEAPLSSLSKEQPATSPSTEARDNTAGPPNASTANPGGEGNGVSSNNNASEENKQQQ